LAGFFQVATPGAISARKKAEFPSSNECEVMLYLDRGVSVSMKAAAIYRDDDDDDDDLDEDALRIFVIVAVMFMVLVAQRRRSS
jgi:hypothetical protein